jgi:DNA-binding response OmpR family regulator
MKKNVLLVEDDPALRMVVREVLKGDFNIDEADNGEDGIDKGLKNKADLVILDYHLPKRDGLEVIAAIKKAHPEVPVIVLTGYLNSDSEKEFNRLGANKIFPKPFNYRALLETVKDLSGKTLAPDLPASEPTVTPANSQSTTPSLADVPILTTSLNALATLAEKIEFLQTITEKQWIENHDLSAIRETTRIMEAEVRKFYGQVNQSLLESRNPTLPAIQAANKPSLLGDN